MNKPSPAEAFVAPELALLPALSVMLLCAGALLRVQHPDLDRCAQRSDSRALRAARALAAEMDATARAVRRYARVARSAVRDAVVDDELPF